MLLELWSFILAELFSSVQIDNLSCFVLSRTKSFLLHFLIQVIEYVGETIRAAVVTRVIFDLIENVFMGSILLKLYVMTTLLARISGQGCSFVCLCVCVLLLLLLLFSHVPFMFFFIYIYIYIIYYAACSRIFERRRMNLRVRTAVIW